MIVAPSEQPRIVEMILNAHPEKRRLIFVHIPKCAGTDLTANLGTRYPTVHQTLADFELDATRATAGRGGRSRATVTAG